MGSIPTLPPSPSLPYWQVNIPASERTPECPPFLLNLTPKDIGIVSTPDSSYTRDTWLQARQKVLTNRIELFQRSPSELRQYLAFTWKLKQEYGSVLNFILSSRLHWSEPVVPRGKYPFEDEGDVKILWNDWPYGIDERIVHLVVWTKFDLEEDERTGDLTDEARGMVDGYVKRVLGEVDEDKVGDEFFLWCWVEFGVWRVANGECFVNRLSGSRIGSISSRSRRLSTSTSCCLIRILSLSGGLRMGMSLRLWERLVLTRMLSNCVQGFGVLASH
jgi:hypothetical protein